MGERTVFESIVSQRHLVATVPEASVCEAARVMTKANCGSILIIDGGDSLLGILTERDLMTRVIAKALDPAHTKVADVMTRHPICVAPDMPVSDAVLLMIERGFRHLPIIAPNADIMGVFSIRDALPLEVDTAESFAEFHAQLNDARG